MFARFNCRGVLGLSAFAIATIAAATQVSAQGRPVVVYGHPEEVNMERVPYGDLNLQASADRKTLYGRVGRAVRNVCNFDRTGIASDYRECSTGAWSGARPQIHAAMEKSSMAWNGSAVGGAFITVRR